MTPKQIQLVQSSWHRIRPLQAVAAELFYGRLFEIAPEVRPLFTRNIHVQGAMLMQTLDTVVASLDQLDTVLPTAERLALRHVDYGVQAGHYHSVGRALLWTLERAMGAEFSPALRDAWAAAYGALAKAMRAAAYPAPAQPADDPLQPVQAAA